MPAQWTTPAQQELPADDNSMGETRVMAPSGQGEDTGALWAASRCHQQITINIKRSYGWGCEKEVIHKGGGHNDDDHPQ